MAGLFKRGFKEVGEEKERQKLNRENMSKGLWRFFVGRDGDEVDISFLTEEPVNFYEHTLQGTKNGKVSYDSKPCTGANCVHCANGSRPSFKSAWLIVDHRETEGTKDGKKTKFKDQVRMFVYGTKVAGQLDRKAQRYGLVGNVYTMIRIGTGTDTTYTFENSEDKLKYTTKEIENLLPETLRTDYDGTMESLYTIVEEQISMLVDDKKSTSNTSKDDEEEEVNTRNNKLVSVDDEEEEDKPTKRKLFKKENSTKKKPLVKKVLLKK